MNSTKLRPGMLSSAVIRNSESRNPLKNAVADFIDNLSQQYDAVSTLHSTIDPEMTRTGHALKVKSTVTRAMEINGKKALRLLEQLHDHERNLHLKAHEKAGLLKPMQEAHLSELRSALRQMTLKEREKAISQAFESGDIAVIRAVQEASSPVLVGSHTLPIPKLLESFVKQCNPELERDLSEVAELYNRLDLVSDSFAQSINAFRNEDLERRAEINKQLTADALAKLDPLIR